MHYHVITIFVHFAYLFCFLFLKKIIGLSICFRSLWRCRWATIVCSTASSKHNEFSSDICFDMYCTLSHWGSRRLAHLDVSRSCHRNGCTSRFSHKAIAIYRPWQWCNTGPIQPILDHCFALIVGCWFVCFFVEWCVRQVCFSTSTIVNNLSNAWINMFIKKVPL